MNPFQGLDERFIAALAAKFPDRLPATNISLKEIRLRQGEQRVLDYLRRVLSDQQEESPNHVHVRVQQQSPQA